MPDLSPSLPGYLVANLSPLPELANLPVKIETYLLLGMLIFGIFKTHRAVRKSESAEERFFTIRVSAFSWLVGTLLLGAFLFLPNKQRVLFLLPVFVITISLAKFWQNARIRIRRERQERIDLERMKRVS